MNDIFNLVLQSINSIAGKKINKKIALNSFLYVISSVIGLKRGYIITNGTKRYINFFGITIAHSGEGKDVSLTVAENMFSSISLYKKIVTNNFNALRKPLPTGDKTNDEDNFILPQQYKIALEGTKEGMMRVANFYNQTDLGSLNVISNEFGHEIQSSTTIPTLTKLWQDAKADGSTNVNEKYPPVNDVPTNILLFGSPSPFQKKEAIHIKLADMIESGLGRRTFFVWSELSEIFEYKEKKQIDIKEIGDEIISYIQHHDKEWIFSKEASDEIAKYRTYLVEKYNKTKRLWDSIRISNIDKIERLSAIICTIDMGSEISADHVKTAISISEDSDKAMEAILKPSMGYIIMYNLLVQNQDGLAQSEMNELGLGIKSQKEFKDQLELLNEYAYRYNKRIKQVGKYRIKLENLPINDLSKIIISVNTEGLGAAGTIGEPYELPFLNDPRSIEQLIRSTKADWFSFVHFAKNKRNSANAIQRQNLIAFDIDDGTTLEDGMNLVTPYTNIIYTTRNHNIEKKGIIADRYRILIPTKTEFSVTPEQHKEMMANVANSIGLKVFDVSTRNIDRLWFPNENAEIFINHGSLFDISCCLPQTENNEKVEKATRKIDYTEISDDKRIEGAIRWALQTAIIGNRNNTLFRLKKMIEEHIPSGSEDVEVIVRKVNSMLSNPIDERELQKTVLR